MKLIVKHLTLFEPICFSSKKENQVNDEELTIYINKISSTDMNPKAENYLTNEKFCGYNSSVENADYKIESGKYFFVQSFLQSEKVNDKQNITELLLQEAQEVFLESLWQEIKFADDTVYIRKLKEGENFVFQLFRKVINF